MMGSGVVARIRTLKPEWLEDEKLAALSDMARVLSVGLILLADDQGRGRANPALVAGHIWSYHSISPTKAQAELERLAAIDFVTLYTVAGQQYYQIRNWTKHQYVQHPGPPRLPGPEQANGNGRPPEPCADTATVWQPPDWVPADLWDAFREMRQRMRAPLTDRAKQLICGRLAALRTEGNDPARVLEQSIERGWKGVFPLDTNGSRKPDIPSRVQPPPIKPPETEEETQWRKQYLARTQGVS